MQGAVCNVKDGVCNAQGGVCNTKGAVCNMQGAVYFVQRAVCNIQRAVRHAQRAVCSIEGTVCNAKSVEGYSTHGAAYRPTGSVRFQSARGGAMSGGADLASLPPHSRQLGMWHAPWESTRRLITNM